MIFAIIPARGGSKRIKKRNAHLYDKKVETEIFDDKVQEYYSLRCVPQILGPVLDTIEYAEKTLLDEINSANDNPIIDRKNKDVYHCCVLFLSQYLFSPDGLSTHHAM